MDLWIRSQNRELLIKPNVLDLDLDDTGIVCGLNNEEYTLGKYKTHERALEVLDEIQRMISGDKTVEKLNETNGNMNNVFPIIFYEMPKEAKDE